MSAKPDSGHVERFDWVKLSPDEEERLNMAYGENSCTRNMVKTSPPLVALPASMLGVKELIYNMKVRSDDVWVVSVPKAGTTWTQEMVWLALHQADTETARKQSLFTDRSKFIEEVFFLPEDDRQAIEQFFSQLDEMPSPRLIKSHLPFQLLPPTLLDTCKVIAVCRNVKDVIVSNYFHEKLYDVYYNLTTDIEGFAKGFMDGLYMYGGYWHHLESIQKRASSANLLILWYEDMKTDQLAAVGKILKHLGVDDDPETMEKIDQYVKFDNYKTNSANNWTGEAAFGTGEGHFLRKGVVGDWKNHFNPGLNQELDSWILENLARLNMADKNIRPFFQLEDEAQKSD